MLKVPVQWRNVKTNLPKIRDGIIKVWVIGNINIRETRWVGGDLGQIIITYSTFQGHKDALNRSQEGDFTAVIRIHSLAEIQLLLRTVETYPVFNRAAPLAAVASAFSYLNISPWAEMWILVVTCGWAAFLSPLSFSLMDVELSLWSSIDPYSWMSSTRELRLLVKSRQSTEKPG